MSRRVEIHVGEKFDTMAKRVAAAWKGAAAGQDVHERHVTFVSWEALAGVMTKKRYELLRHLHHHPAVSIAALARAIGRDYKRVHEDVEVLAELGLIERAHGVSAPFDTIEATIRL